MAWLQCGAPTCWLMSFLPYTYSINKHDCWLNLCATASSTRLIVFVLFCRREAVYLFMGGMLVEVRSLGRVDATFQKTHGRQTIQMSSLRSRLLSLWSPQPSYETTLVLKYKVSLRSRLLTLWSPQPSYETTLVLKYKVSLRSRLLSLWSPQPSYETTLVLKYKVSLRSRLLTLWSPQPSYETTLVLKYKVYMFDYWVDCNTPTKDISPMFSDINCHCHAQHYKNLI